MGTIKVSQGKIKYCNYALLSDYNQLLIPLSQGSVGGGPSGDAGTMECDRDSPMVARVLGIMKPN